jgi:hypothetical protein
VEVDGFLTGWFAVFLPKDLDSPIWQIRIIFISRKLEQDRVDVAHFQDVAYVQAVL